MENSQFRHISIEERVQLCMKNKQTVSPTVTDIGSNEISSSNGKPKKRSVFGIFKLIGKSLVVLFALIGVGFIAVYFSVNLHLTNVEGILDKQTDGFWDRGGANVLNSLITEAGEDNSGTISVFFNEKNYCSLKLLKNEYPGTFRRIIDLALNGDTILAQNNLNVALNSIDTKTKESGISDCTEIFTNNISRKDFEILAGTIDDKNLFIFATSTEWKFFKMGVLKDKDVIKRVENETGVKSRIIVAQLVAEQMRLFYMDRAWFEKAISPVKVLASMSQFSWGVLGIKKETAERIEENLKNKSSEYYLGTEFEHALDFSTSSKNINQERFKRITNYRDHYYSYLYTGLFNKQIISQWNKAGIDISNRPEILATIYNIGFIHSKPNTDPQMGGAELFIAGKRYSFGRLAYEFYYSGELLDEFPQ